MQCLSTKFWNTYDYGTLYRGIVDRSFASASLSRMSEKDHGNWYFRPFFVRGATVRYVTLLLVESFSVVLLEIEENMFEGNGPLYLVIPLEMKNTLLQLPI